MVKYKHVLTWSGWLLLIIIIIFILAPFMPLFIWSITKQWQWPLLFPQDYTFKSWVYVFSDSGKGIEGLYNSVLIALLTLFMNIILGIPAARVLAHKQFIGKIVVFLILLSPIFVPFTASIIGMYKLSLHIDFMSNYIRVSLAHVLITFPYFIGAIWYQYRLMGTKIQEAAMSLGASSWQILLWVELPYLFPALSLASVFVIIISLSQYLPTWIMSGGTLTTLPLIMFPFASSGDASLVSAYSLLIFITIFCLLIFFLMIRRRA